MWWACALHVKDILEGYKFRVLTLWRRRRAPSHRCHSNACHYSVSPILWHSEWIVIYWDCSTGGHYHYFVKKKDYTRRSRFLLVCAGRDWVMLSLRFRIGASPAYIHAHEPFCCMDGVNPGNWLQTLLDNDCHIRFDFFLVV